MFSDATKEHPGSILAVSILFGLLSGGAIVFTLSAVGLPLFEASVFAVLSGFTLGAFLYRERALTYSSDRLRNQQRLEVARLEKRIQYYYEDSLSCLAYFDAGTLLIDKVSPGFLQLFRVPSALEVRGKSIVEILRVAPSTFETIVIKAKRELSDEARHYLLAEDSQGEQLPIEFTAKYDRDSHMVEAAFFVSPLSGREEVEKVDIARQDLDRFRRGMYRRETRILELKEEVNDILKEAGQEPRYRFDRKTQDTHSPLFRKSNRQEAL